MWLSDDRQSGPRVPCAVGAVEEWPVQRRVRRDRRARGKENQSLDGSLLLAIASSSLLRTLPPPPVDDSPNGRAARDKGHIAEVADMVSAPSRIAAR